MTPALTRLTLDAIAVPGYMLRFSERWFDIFRSPGIDTEGRPLWGVRVYLTERQTFEAAHRFDGPHVTTVHTIHEVRSILFDPDYGAPT
jgi:hypothetical protein